MTKRPNYVFDDELYHWGIKGQRWGERRFQNEDGSWTPEGRERYGKGDGERVKIEKAKATYETQKYKANLKSKAQKEKDKRAAAEERNRIKEQAKTNKLIKKEQAKLDQQGAKKFSKTKNMSDEDLAKSIERLKLQSEYNKQYALAKNPDGALAKADRFFSGETGKFVRDLAVQTLPTVANTVVSKVLDSKLKYANKEDRDAAAAALEKIRAEAESFRSKSAFQNAQAKEKLADIANKSAENASKRKDEELARIEKMKESNRINALTRSKLKTEESNRKIVENEAKLQNQIAWNKSKIDNQNSFDANKRANETAKVQNQIAWNKSKIDNQSAFDSNTRANDANTRANQQAQLDSRLKISADKREDAKNASDIKIANRESLTKVKIAKDQAKANNYAKLLQVSANTVKVPQGSNSIIKTYSTQDFNKIKNNPGAFENSEEIFKILNGLNRLR